jgi:RNA polymerase sigma factor (sigma-70 family)
MGPDDEAGADLMHAGGDLPNPDSNLDADKFCIKQRQDWLAYAMALARNWPDAEDAVSHVVEKIYERHARNGTVCPEGRDPVAWSKTVIRNYVTDSYRRRAAEDKRARVLAPSARDLAEDVTDRIIVRNALRFVASLDSRAHEIAIMRWVDGLEPQEIASQLGMNPRSVRTSLHRTKKKMRTVLGVAGPREDPEGEDDMTGLIVAIISVVAIVSVTWVVARKRAARQEREAAELYRQYVAGIQALTQTYLLQAPSDEEWLAGIEATGLDTARKPSQAKDAESVTRIDALMPTAERDRTGWHRDAGRALAEAGAPTDQVARQLLRAFGADGAAEPMEEWMLTWLARTADPLVREAPGVAAELLTLAVANSPIGSAEHIWLASRLADALYRVGNRAVAEQVAVRALEYAVEPDLIVDLHWTLAQCRMLSGESAESLATLDGALASPGISARHRARLLVLAARTHDCVGEFEKASQIAASALDAASEAGDNWAMGWALHVLTLVTAAQRRVTDTLPLFDRALAVTQSDPALTDLRLLLQINKAITLARLDRYEEALASAVQARQLAGQGGATFRAAQAHSALAQLFFQTGQWDDALAEVGALPEDIKEPGVVCCELGIAAVISFHRGDAAAAGRYLDAAGPHARRIGHRLIGPLALARSLDLEHDGGPSEALTALIDAFDGNTEDEETEDLLADAARLAIQTGNLSTTRAVADHAAALAAESEIPHRQAIALYCRGLLDHDAHQLLAAAERYDDASRPLLRAEALEAAAREFADTGDLGQARAAFTRAVEAYSSLGAAADIARLRAAFRAHGIRRGLRARHGRARSGWDSHTPAEINVAAFVEEKLSNPEIAAKPLLPRRTVATHVSHGLLQN